jgi:hypothetical protein
MPRVKKSEENTEKEKKVVRRVTRKKKAEVVRKPPSTLDLDIEIQDKQYLTDLELSRITINAEKHEVYRRTKEISELKRMLLKVTRELHESKIETLERENLLLDKLIKEQVLEYDAFKKKSRMDLEKIGEAHGIQVGEKFGYNPESGEIIVK